MEDRTSAGNTTHDLLLALAGWVDDDLLTQARELAAIGEDARAVELITASLVACRAVLPEQVRSAVVAGAQGARSDLDPATALPPPHAGDGIEHRFSTPSDDDPVAAALLTLPPRALAGCRVLLTHRRTPAGQAPGPLPHPVVLVQAPADRHAEVLGYQVAVALERRDLPASVEVLPVGTEPSDYHAAALRKAVPVIAADDEEQAAQETRSAPRHQPDHEPEQPPARRRLPDTAGLLGPTLQNDELLGGILRPVRLSEPQETRAAHELRAARSEDSAAHEPEVTTPDAVALETAADPADSGTAVAGITISDTTASDTAASSSAPPGMTVPEIAQAPDLGTVALGSSGSGQSNGPASGIRRGTARERPKPTSEPVPPPAPRPSSVKEEPPARPSPRPVPTPTGRIRRPLVTPISRASVPNPIPLVRRSGPTPIVRPITPGEPAQRAPREPVTDEAVETVPSDDAAQDTSGQRRAGRRVESRTEANRTVPRAAANTETSAFDAIGQPLRGPLDEPLPASPLDPTINEDDPLGVAEKLPRNDSASSAMAEEEWTSDWFSGAWAMTPANLAGRSRPQPKDREAAADPAPDNGTAAAAADDTTPAPVPRPAPRRPARHRYLVEPESARNPGAEGPADAEPGSGPVTASMAEARPQQESPQLESLELGLRPDSGARLSEADRQLLARLQAELLEGRKPRPTRRPGIGSTRLGTNGVGTNGSHRSDPPDLAG